MTCRLRLSDHGGSRGTEGVPLGHQALGGRNCNYSMVLPYIEACAVGSNWVIVEGGLQLRRHFRVAAMLA